VEKNVERKPEDGEDAESGEFKACFPSEGGFDAEVEEDREREINQGYGRQDEGEHISHVEIFLVLVNPSRERKDENVDEEEGYMGHHSLFSKG